MISCRRTAWFVVLALTLVASRGVEAGTWEPTTWNGERALMATDSGWTAVVSVERGRLVSIARENGGENLLFAPATRRGAAGWGGHRLWLGPQTEWPGGWPPPAAWEASAAQRVEVRGAELELSLPPSGDGWPRLTREYFWREGKLHCIGRAEGGARAAQLIHILQVPRSARATLKTATSVTVPRGYVQLHLGRGPEPVKVFERPMHAMEKAGSVELSFAGHSEKLGVLPQPIDARIGEAGLKVTRGAASGLSEATPDEGFVTQVYLGDERAPLIELEQLSALMEPGGQASFEIIVEPGLVDGQR